MDNTTKLKVALEAGKKRVMVSGIDYPGWSRHGKSEAEALETLLTYGPRYQAVMSLGKISFDPPTDVTQLEIIERLPGGSGTDFGAMDAIPQADYQPVEEQDLPELFALFHSGWLALKIAAEAAEGKELRRGPRGGGRDLDAIIQHAVDVQAAYLKRINYKAAVPPETGIPERIQWIEGQVQEGLRIAVREGVPEQGPRGGKMWTPRHFVRHSLWHLLDHVWEIEDRILP